MPLSRVARAASGLPIAARFASEGARVALWDVDGAAARKSAQSLGAQHRADAVDITDEASVDAAADAVYDAFGRVDILVNNAGILGPVAPLWEQKPAEFRRVIDVNLTGMYLVCRAIVPRMRSEAGPVRGRIVNVSSIQGKEGLAQSGAYGISKAGVIGLTKILGKELARRRHHGQLRDAGGGRDRHGEGDHGRAPRGDRLAHSDGTFRRGRRRSPPWWRFSHPTTADSRPAPSSTCRAAGPLTRSRTSIMALAGKGAIIIWNDITPEGRDEFYDWHLHEHIPERLGVPGFRRGSRSIAIIAAKRSRNSSRSTRSTIRPSRQARLISRVSTRRPTGPSARPRIFATPRAR